MLVPALYYSAKDLTSPASWAIPAVLVWFGIGLVVLVMLKARGADLTVGLRQLTAAAEDDVVADPPGS